MRIQLNKPLSFRLGNFATILLYLLIATDSVFILIHCVHQFSSLLPNDLFSLERDRGYSEIFQYIKEFWITLLLGFLAIQYRSILYFGWSSLFFYLLLDDSLEIHEKLGRWFSLQLGFSNLFGLRSNDFGELLVSGFMGLFFLILLSTAYRSSERSFRKSSKTLILLLVILAFFGIVGDVLHTLAKGSSANDFFGILEDGSELIVMSAIASFVFELAHAHLACKNLDQPIPEMVSDRR